MSTYTDGLDEGFERSKECISSLRTDIAAKDEEIFNLRSMVNRERAVQQEALAAKDAEIAKLKAGGTAEPVKQTSEFDWDRLAFVLTQDITGMEKLLCDALLDLRRHVEAIEAKLGK